MRAEREGWPRLIGIKWAEWVNRMKMGMEGKVVSGVCCAVGHSVWVVSARSGVFYFSVSVCRPCSLRLFGADDVRKVYSI